MSGAGVIDDTPDTPDPPDTTEPWVRVGRGPRRRTRWDRPPYPKDWRFFVGWLGRTLIVLGLLMFLFVAYQLWGTGIETARAQNRLEDRWAELLAGQDTAPPGPATTGAPPQTVPPQTLPPVTVPGSTTPTGNPVTLPPETVPPASTTTVPPAPVNLPPPEREQPLAFLAIPTIDVAYFVVPGVSRNDLKLGPGHFPDTPIPGTLGNSAIAGHRTTHKAPFSRLDELAPGDDVEVQLANGTSFVYVVTGSEVVTPADYHVVSDSDPERATLTLVTCDPPRTSSHRLIVYAELDPARSDPVGAATFYDLGDTPTEQLPGESAATTSDATPDATPDATLAPDETRPTGTTSDGGTAVPVSEPAVPATTAPVTPDDGFVDAPVEHDTDAFSEGWFAEAAAWPHIIVWALALAALATLGWLIARYWKREWAGVVAVAIPFAVCLYFFFQNVNRLLPAGL